MHMRRSSLQTLLAVTFSTAGITQLASAQIVVDGVVDPTYGAPIVVQQNATGFGDNNDPSPATANGSEIDAAYGKVNNGRLYLMFTGNIETNFNKLEVFIAG